MQIQCTGCAWALASSPPTAEWVYLYHVSVFGICMPANDKGPLLFRLNTLRPILYVCAFVCATPHFGSLSQAGVAHKLAWHCGPHGALSAIRSLCCRFINTMQRGGINGDNYSSIEWGLLGALDYQHFYEAFSFPLWRIVLLWPLAPSGSSHHTRLRISDCIMSVALVSGQYAEARL